MLRAFLKQSFGVMFAQVIVKTVANVVFGNTFLMLCLRRPSLNVFRV